MLEKPFGLFVSFLLILTLAPCLGLRKSARFGVVIGAIGIFHIGKASAEQHIRAETMSPLALYVSPLLKSDSATEWAQQVTVD